MPVLCHRHLYMQIYKVTDTTLLITLQPPGQPPPGPMPMRLTNKVGVVGVKMEYLEEWGFEMLLPDELARWWAAIVLHPQPNCELVVSHHTSHRIHFCDHKVNTPSFVTLITLQYVYANLIKS